MFGFEHLIKNSDDGKKNVSGLDADAESESIWTRIVEAQNEGDDDQEGVGGRKSNNNQSQKKDDDYCCGLCASLTFAERLFFCLLMHVGGYILDLGSLHRFMHLIKGSPLPFVALWTLGHVVCLLGTTFLVGPKRQFDGMFHESRRAAAIAYIATMILTMVILIVCIVLDRPTGLWVGFILVCLLICQCACIGWYTISYIKFLYKFITQWIARFKKENSGNGKPSGKRSSGGGVRWMVWKRNEYEQIV